MDIVINSNVQSPLVRTLSATQGKSASFTHHIKDNVPPVSFSKIALTPDGGASGTYGRNYKFKIPQYGYLRSFILKFSGAELGLGSLVVEDILRLFGNLKAPNGAADQGNAVIYQGNGSTTGVGYDIRDVFGSRRNTAGNTVAPNTYNWVPAAFVPPYDANARNPNIDPWASMYGRIRGGANYSADTDLIPAVGDARIFPYRMSPRFDLIHFMQKGRVGLNAAGNNSSGYFETSLTAFPAGFGNYDPMFAVPTEGLDWHYIPDLTANFLTVLPDTTNYLSGAGLASVSGKVGGTNVTSASITDAGAPNVNLSKRYLGQRLMSTYDWCSQANLSRHLGALMPATVTLSTQTRFIQTIYPM
jgi:hypothetical protein